MFFGFPPSIICLITWGVSGSNLAVLWNGSKLDNFSPARGLRQGDHLSLYLFVLYMERLALRIDELRENNTGSLFPFPEGDGSSFDSLVLCK